MKKYIRTKNGNILNSSRGLTSMIVTKDDILKEADTIKELCDMFVVGLDEKMPIEMPLSEKEQYEKMKDIVVLGLKAKMKIWLKLAIWTDKGLIYIAKMNEKGELELI